MRATACEFESFSSCPFAFSQVPASEHYNKSALALKDSRKLFRNCFTGLHATARVNYLVTAMIHAFWEFSPFIAGLVSGLLTSIRNRLQQRALIIKASLAMGIVFACAAGELAGTSLTAVVSIIVDSGAVAAGLIVAHVVVKRFAVLRSQLQGP
jgi:hypothetical protein